MVETIKNIIHGTDIKTRESKTSTRKADSQKEQPAGEALGLTSHDAEVVLFQNSGSISSIDAKIASANTKASLNGIESKEEADEMLRQATKMILQKPDVAESAQANISSRIVLNLFETA